MKLLIVFFFHFTALSAVSQNVFYGERKVDSESLALYFDKNGFPYPDYHISDSSMQKAYGSLFTWFLQNGGQFIAISAKYELFPEKIDSETIYQLRDSINAVNARKINERSNSIVAFYIHGFRKAFTPQNKDVTSVEEFTLLKSNLASYQPERPSEVEVYWDGMYDCCFSMKQKKNKQLYKMFETAGQNAIHAGIGLRRVLCLIESDSLQIIAHSLGSKVAHSALHNYSEDSDVRTPAQKSVRIVYLAPALDASDFYLYHSRKDHYGYTNYHFLIVYNEKDFVLRKKDPKIGVFGPGVNKYGCTALGCNKRKNAQKMLRKMHDKTFCDIRLLDKTDLGKAHSLRYYAREAHLKEVSEFLYHK